MVYAIDGIGFFGQQINRQFKTVPLCISTCKCILHGLIDGLSSKLVPWLKGESNEYAQTCLGAVMDAVWKDDDHDEFCGGANSYKTKHGKVVFLTQAESYNHRGLAFAHYSQLEFECIVQLKEKVQLQEKAELTKKSSKDRGCKPRPTFPLRINHPLYTSHVGVI